MGTPLETTAANNPTDIGQCTGCEKVFTLIRSTRGDLIPTGTDGSCSVCGNSEFTVVDA